MALTDNLISFWELEETSGTRVDKVTATGNDLTDVNTVTSNPGIVGTAAQFTRANSEQLTRLTNSSLELGANDAFTWNLWVFLDSTAERITFINKYGGGAAITIAYLIEKNTAANFRMLIANGTVQVTADASTFGAPSVSTWYMITCWKDNVGNLAHIAINNGASNSVALTGTVAEVGTFRIGARVTSDFMNGRIDQVGFWKRVLTADERTQLYNGGNGLSYAQMQIVAADRYGSSPTIRSLGLITSTTTAARITNDTALFCSVIGFQWVSGTVTIGDSTVTVGAANAYCTLDTTTRMRELRTGRGFHEDALPIRDFFCIGSGSFICYYQVN